TGLFPVFSPPCPALTLELSTTARSHESRPSACNSARLFCHSLCQTPRACHSKSLRRQVCPEGKSLVAGRFFHGTPVFKAKMMPVITLRSSVGFLPACWTLRRFCGFGSSGSTRCHS